MGKLKKTYSMNEIRRLDTATKNGIRAAYYSQAKVKNDKNKIDKSIKSGNLSITQIVEMLRKIGCSVTDAQVVAKPTTNSKEDELKKREADLANRENVLKNEKEALYKRENELKIREVKLVEREKELSEKEKELDQKVKMLLEGKKTVDERKKFLDERDKLTSGGEKEFNDRITVLLQNESYLRQKKAEFDERENKLQQKEIELNQIKQELDKRENDLQEKELELNNEKADVSSKRQENDDHFLSGLDDPQQVVGIKLRQSERTRLLSKDGERSRLIEEAAREICNKWLQIRDGKFDTTGSHTTEEFAYDFIQEFAKSNFPYIGKNVYKLVLYDLKKSREEKNAVTSDV